MKSINESITEAYETMYAGNQILNEELHPEIQKIMDSDTIAPKEKLSQVTKKVKSLIGADQDTGLEGDKPKKGSSRAVFFPKDEKKLKIDGVETSSPTAVKIAYPGWADKKLRHPQLLGEMQNEAEGNSFINNNYGVFRHDHHTGEYHTNENPVLAPVFGIHPENHHLEMGRVERFNAKDMAAATKTKEFPKGLKLSDVSDAMKYHHEMAHGKGRHNPEMEKISDHPYVANMIDMMHNSGMHPGDIVPHNMGIYRHPVTKEGHPVIHDWGLTNELGKLYAQARKTL
jgi:hypothetical protein